MEIKRAKHNLMRKVLYNGAEYTMTECILWVDATAKKLKYSATLIDGKSNSTMRVPLDAVEELEENAN